MRMPIGFGSFNKYYFLILGSFAVKVLWALIDGIDPTLKIKMTFSLIKTNNIYFQHVFVKSTIKYLGILIGGFIFYSISKVKEKNLLKEQEKKNKKKIENINKVDPKKNDPKKPDPLKKVEFIHYDYLEENFRGVKRIALLLVFLYFISDIFINVLNEFEGGDVNFWILEILFMMFFEYKILHMKIYQHQKISVQLMILFSFSLQIVSAVVQRGEYDCSFFEATGKLDVCKYKIYLEYNSAFIELYYLVGLPKIILFIVLYLMSMMFNSYISVKQKWLMDNRFVSPYYLLLIIGLTGFFFSILILVIISFIPCNEDSINTKVYCMPLKESDGNIRFYFDSIFTFFNNIKDNLANDETKTACILELAVCYPLYMIASFANSTLVIFVIKYLHPTYLILINVLFHLFIKFFAYKFEAVEDDYYVHLNFILKEVSYIIAFLCYLIYLEIIELRFCEYDTNLKDRIIDRGMRETKDSIGGETLNGTFDIGEIEIDTSKNQELVNYSTSSYDIESEK